MEITRTRSRYSDEIVKNTKREVSIDYIQKVVSDYFQMDIELFSQKKLGDILFRPDNLQCTLNLLKPPWQVLEVKLVKRDHATVLHACKTVDNFDIYNHDKFRKYVEDLGKNYHSLDAHSWDVFFSSRFQNSPINNF